jgi:nicotinate-nucleotide pyrophosphorylase (carboxylating)
MSETLEPALYREVVRHALAEDLGWGDTTTQAMVGPTARAVGVLAAHANVVLAGLDVAIETFRQLDPGVAVEPFLQDGDRCPIGSPIARLEGLAAPMLTAERTALNFLRHLSGIATVTRWLVDQGGGQLRVGDTRKTLPLLRALQKYAVRAGGGVTRRGTLDEAIIIKMNHIVFTGGIDAAVRAARAAQPDAPIETEVVSAEQAEAAVRAGVSGVIFVGPSRDELDRIIKQCAGRARVLVSGGMPAERLVSLARAGVDIVLVGSMTESAPAVDITLDLQPA